MSRTIALQPDRPTALEQPCWKTKQALRTEPACPFLPIVRPGRFLAIPAAAEIAAPSTHRLAGAQRDCKEIACRPDKPDLPLVYDHRQIPACNGAEDALTGRKGEHPLRNVSRRQPADQAHRHD